MATQCSSAKPAGLAAMRSWPRFRSRFVDGQGLFQSFDSAGMWRVILVLAE